MHKQDYHFHPSVLLTIAIPLEATGAVLKSSLDEGEKEGVFVLALGLAGKTIGYGG